MCQTGGKLCIKRKTREDPAGYISNLPGVEFKGQTRLNLTIMPDKEDKSRIVSKSSTPNVMMCYFWFSKQLFEFSFSPAPQIVTTLATNHCTMGKLQWEVGHRNFSLLREKYIWNIWTRIKWEAKLTNLPELSERC